MAVDYSKLLDGNSLRAIRNYLITNYQPLNANLSSISLLADNVTGLIKMTNGVASLDGTNYAPLASPTFTGTVTLPTSVKIGTSTSTGLVKYTNGVLSIDTSSYKTDYRYRPIKVGGTQKLSNTSATALDFVNPASGYNVVFEWDSTNNGVKANVDLSAYLTSSDAANTYQPLNSLLTLILNASGLPTAGQNAYLKIHRQDHSGMELEASWISTFPTSAIPSLDASKITSGTFADARIASAATWNAKYDKPSGGIPASDLAESYILASEKGAANGVASLGSDGKVPTSQLPQTVLGGMQYKGTFNATSGSTISGLEIGWYYICSTAGTKNPDGTSGPTDGYEIGDWAVYNGSTAGWAKIDNSDHVSSVNNKTGAVTLTYSDVGAAAASHAHGNITNTGTITSTVVTSATGVLVYDSSNKIQRATAAQTRTIIGAGTYSKPSGGIPASDLAESYYLASNPNRYVGLVSVPGGQNPGNAIAISGGGSGTAQGGTYIQHNSTSSTYNVVVLPTASGNLALTTDIPNYEADTLATVTSRGATTSTQVKFAGGLGIAPTENGTPWLFTATQSGSSKGFQVTNSDTYGTITFKFPASKPAGTYTLATLEDIEAIDVYTYNEAYAILDGSAT